MPIIPLQKYTPTPIKDWEALYMELQTLAGRLPAPLEDWHEIGAAGEPAFENSFLNYTGNTDWCDAGFRKDADGLVTCVGLITAGTAPASDVYTLPEGYRPFKQVAFPAYSVSSVSDAAIFIVKPTGGIELHAVINGTWSTTNNVSWADMGSIKFYVDSGIGK